MVLFDVVGHFLIIRDCFKNNITKSHIFVVLNQACDCLVWWVTNEIHHHIILICSVLTCLPTHCYVNRKHKLVYVMFHSTRFPDVSE